MVLNNNLITMFSNAITLDSRGYVSAGFGQFPHITSIPSGNPIDIIGTLRLNGQDVGLTLVKSGTIQMHPAAAKLPSTGMPFIDASNYNWELQYSGSGQTPSGLWQFALPMNYSGNAQVTIFATCKTGQGGASNTQFDVYAMSIPAMGGTTVNTSPQFINSGTIVWDNAMPANTARKLNISLSSYTGFGADQYTTLVIARNNTQVTGNNVTGFVAYVGGYFAYQETP
jgi:hypothetical protein